MLPRECDNDFCDYEAREVDGVTRVVWNHVPECQEAPGAYLRVVSNGTYTDIPIGSWE